MRTAAALIVAALASILAAAEPETVLRWNPYPEHTATCPDTSNPAPPVGMRLYHRIALTETWDPTPLVELPLVTPPICFDTDTGQHVDCPLGRAVEVITEPVVAVSPIKWATFPAGTVLELALRGVDDQGRESCESNLVTIVWPDVCAFGTRTELLACMGVVE